MFNTKFNVLVYGFIWLCNDIIGIHYIGINCILVGAKSKNLNLNRFYQDIELINYQINKHERTAVKPEKDYTRDKKLMKKHDKTSKGEDEPVSWISFQEDDDHREKKDSQYFIGYGYDPFGHSIPWHEHNRSISNITVKNKNITILELTRGKRGVAHLYNMVSCATGCNPLSYKGYGCYCGFLGSGRVTDPIDRCCMIHDACYSDVRCPSFSVYVTPYLWRCWNGFPQCALDHVAFGGPNSCSSQLCECDKQLALCLSSWPCPNGRALCRSSPFRLLQNLLLF